MDASIIITPQRKSGEEMFCAGESNIGLSLFDYWAWAHSDLVENTERGKLAEFIVASALDAVEGISKNWGSYDLNFMGKGIEVKSSAFLQSWYQKKATTIRFNLPPTYAWDDTTNTSSTERKRQADVYVFCLLKHKDKATVNPLNLAQWEFYIVPTSLLNEKIPMQKSTSLYFFHNNGILPCGYQHIRPAVEQLISHMC